MNQERVYQKIRVLKTSWSLLRRAVVTVQRNGKPSYTIGDAIDQAIEIFAAKVEAKFGPLPTEDEDFNLRHGRRVDLSP